MVKYPDELSALNEAIEKAGGQTALAKALSDETKILRQGNISNWLRDQRCSVQYVLKIEQITGVSRHRLRPDVYPEELSVTTQSA